MAKRGAQMPAARRTIDRRNRRVDLGERVFGKDPVGLARVVVPDVAARVLMPAARIATVFATAT